MEFFINHTKGSMSLWHTIKPRTPEHGTTEHGIPVEHRISSGILRRNTGTLAQLQNTGGTIGISQKSGTREHRHSNRTTKQHQEILPIQNDDVLSR